MNPLRYAVWLLAAVLSTAACGATAQRRGGPGLRSGVPRSGIRSSVLRVRIPTNLASLDCVLRGDVWCDRVLIGTVYEPLVRWDSERRRIVPWLATKWRRADGGRALDLTLRAGVKWHNGAPFTAKDVRASILSFANRGSGAPGTTPLTRRLGRVLESVHYTSPRHVRIRFKKPFGPVLPLLAALPMRPAPDRLSKTAEPAVRVVGTGPFRFVQWWPDVKVVLSRWRGYWGRPAPLRTLEFRVLRSLQAAEAAFRAGTVDLIPDLDTLTFRRARRRLAHRDPVPLFAEPAAFSFLALNPRGAPFTDRRVREAVLRLIDRRALLATLPGGPPALLPGPVWRHGPQARGLSDPWGPAPTPRRARRLLRSAGWTRAPGRPWIRGGRPLRFEILTASRAVAFNQGLRKVKAGLASAGVEMVIRRRSWPQVLVGISRGTYQATAWITRLDSPWTSLSDLLAPKKAPRSGAPPGLAALFPVLARLVKRSRIEPSLPRRQRLERQALARLAATALLLPLHTPRLLSLARCRLDPWINTVTWIDLSRLSGGCPRR